jgi:type VI secretion system secreted protein VgrG
MVSIGGTTNLTVGKDQVEQIKGDKHLRVKGDRREEVEGDDFLKVDGRKHVAVDGHYAMKTKDELYLDGDTNVVIESKTTLTLMVGGNFIKIDATGVTIVGTMVLINSGGSPGSASPCTTLSPHDPAEADDAKPGEMGSAISFQKKRPVVPPASYGPQALVLKSAAQSGAPFCEH